MKTMNDLYKLSLTDPVVNAYMKLVENKEMKIEDALIGMVFTLRDQKNDVTDKYINHLQNCTMPSTGILKKD